VSGRCEGSPLIHESGQSVMGACGGGGAVVGAGRGLGRESEDVPGGESHAIGSVDGGKDGGSWVRCLLACGFAWE